MAVSLAAAGAFLCLLFTTILIFLKKRYSFWSEKNIPGPEPSLIYGNLYEMRKEAHMFAHQRWAKKYGKVFGVFDFTKPKLIVADADLVKQMMVQDFSKLANRRPDGFDHPLERKFSIVQEYDEWKKSRTVFSSALSANKLKLMFNQTTDCSVKLKEYFDHLVSSGQGDNINAYEMFSKFTSDKISRSLLNVSIIDSYSASDDKMSDCLNNYVVLTKFRRYIGLMLPGWFKTAIHFSQFNIKALEYPISLMQHILDERRKMPNDSMENDILKALLNSSDKHNMSEDNLRINLIGLYLAGQVSTCSALSYFVYTLAKYPHVQENLIKELEEFEKTGESLSTDSLSKHFPYLDAVLSEIQRLWPSSTFTERRVSSDGYTFSHEGKQYTVPKGTVVYFPIFVIHRDPDYYERPDEFDERRFLPENRQNLHPYAFVTFGHGPRNCSGARMAINIVKSAILTIVKSYKFTLVDSANDPMSDLNDTLDELLTPKPIRVKIEKIK